MNNIETISSVGAMKLALEALHGFIPYLPLNDEAQCGRYDKALTAIKEALMSVPDGAQPEHDKTDVRCECCGYMTYHREHLGCIRAAKFKEPEQEPFCYVYIENGEEFFAPKNAYVPDDAKPLYTTPPQRTWVGLTDKDWNRSKHNYDFQKGADWAESILKENNA